MNIRTKLILSVGVLAGMIILLVALSVVNLQILTATEPDSPAAVPGLQRALLWISVIGGVCIFAIPVQQHFCQYHIVGMASPFHQQTYSRTDAWDS